MLAFVLLNYADYAYFSILLVYDLWITFISQDKKRTIIERETWTTNKLHAKKKKYIIRSTYSIYQISNIKYQLSKIQNEEWNYLGKYKKCRFLLRPRFFSNCVLDPNLCVWYQDNRYLVLSTVRRFNLTAVIQAVQCGLNLTVEIERS